MTSSILTLFLTIFMILNLVNASSTNLTVNTQNQLSKIIYTLEPYTTIDNLNGNLLIKTVEITNITTFNINDINDKCLNIEDLIFNLICQIINLIIYILSYKYIISNLCFIYNTYNRLVNFFEEKQSIPEIPITIKRFEEIDEDDEDSKYQFHTVYTTSIYNFIEWDCEKTKINDVIFKGDSYIEISPNILYTINYKPIKIKNPTYKDLLIIASLNPINKEKYISHSLEINSNDKFNNIQIIKIVFEN